MQRHNKLTRVHEYGVRLAAKGPIRRLPPDDRFTLRSRLSGEQYTDEGCEADESSHCGTRSTSCTSRSRSFRPISVDPLALSRARRFTWRRPSARRVKRAP